MTEKSSTTVAQPAAWVASSSSQIPGTCNTNGGLEQSPSFTARCVFLCCFASTFGVAVVVAVAVAAVEAVVATDLLGTLPSWSFSSLVSASSPPFPPAVDQFVTVASRISAGTAEPFVLPSRNDRKGTGVSPTLNGTLTTGVLTYRGVAVSRSAVAVDTRDDFGGEVNAGSDVTGDDNCGWFCSASPPPTLELQRGLPFFGGRRP